MRAHCPLTRSPTFSIRPGAGNQDLDGVIFPDMPWILDPIGAVGGARDSGRARVPGARRLSSPGCTPSATTPTGWSTSCPRLRSGGQRLPARRHRPAHPWTPTAACGVSSTGRRSSPATSRPGRRPHRSRRPPREHGTAPRARPCSRGGGGAIPGAAGMPHPRRRISVPRAASSTWSPRTARCSRSSRSAIAPRTATAAPPRASRTPSVRASSAPRASARHQPPAREAPGRFDVVEVSGPPTRSAVS